MGDETAASAFKKRKTTFDCTKAKVVIGPADRANMLAQSPENTTSQATKIAIRHAVGAAYPNGMKLSESDYWEFLQENLINTDKTSAEVTMGEVEWLIKTFEKENIPFGPSFVQWICAVNRYCKQLKDEEEKKIAAEKTEQPAA